jgi:hypothetical protein
LRELVSLRGLNEVEKPNDYAKLGGRIQLLHEVIEAGLARVLQKERHHRTRQKEATASRRVPVEAEKRHASRRRRVFSEGSNS